MHLQSENSHLYSILKESQPLFLQILLSPYSVLSGAPMNQAWEHLRLGLICTFSIALSPCADSVLVPQFCDPDPSSLFICGQSILQTTIGF